MGKKKVLEDYRTRRLKMISGSNLRLAATVLAAWLLTPAALLSDGTLLLHFFTGVPIF
jgi:hypothetical protein